MCNITICFFYQNRWQLTAETFQASYVLHVLSLNDQFLQSDFP